jgi:hypothetical protein
MVDAEQLGSTSTEPQLTGRLAVRAGIWSRRSSVVRLHHWTTCRRRASSSGASVPSAAMLRRRWLSCRVKSRSRRSLSIIGAGSSSSSLSAICAPNQAASRWRRAATQRNDRAHSCRRNGSAEGRDGVSDRRHVRRSARESRVDRQGVEEVHDHGLLCQQNVRPLLICSIDTYEAVMFLASQGRYIGVLFESKQSADWRRVRLDVFLHSTSTEPHFRLPMLEERFEVASQRSVEMLRTEARIPAS